MLAARPAPTRPSRNLLRPWTRETRRERRVGYRLAAGLTPAQAARAENLREAEVDALLADPAFAALVEECRALENQPEAEARRKLTSLARFILTEALVEGDLRAAMFVLRQEERGRCPARVLVDGVLASRQRAAAMPAPPSPALAEPAPPRAPRDPVDRSLEHIAARFRDALVGEQLIQHRATATESPATAESVPSQPSEPQPITAPEPPQSRNRRQRRRSAALRRREVRGATPPDRPRPPPPPRARGP